MNVSIISPDTRSTRRFDLHLTVADLKSKLEMVTGIPASAQQIALYNNEEEAETLKDPILILNEDERPIGFYSLRDGCVLKVTILRSPSFPLAQGLSGYRSIREVACWSIHRRVTSGEVRALDGGVRRA